MTTIDDVLGSPHSWYHTVDLAPDVATPGWIDLRDVVANCHFPENLSGKRAIDITALLPDYFGEA